MPGFICLIPQVRCNIADSLRGRSNTNLLESVANFMLSTQIQQEKRPLVKGNRSCGLFIAGAQHPSVTLKRLMFCRRQKPFKTILLSQISQVNDAHLNIIPTNYISSNSILAGMAHIEPMQSPLNHHKHGPSVALSYS